MKTETTSRVVFTGTSDWWRLVSRDEIEVGESFEGEWETAVSVADLDLDDEEAWVACVTEVSQRHSAIRIGDYICCQGIGSDLIFVRL